PRMVTSNGVPYSPLGSFSPAITPDGSRVAFVTLADRRDGINPGGEICVWDSATGATSWASSNAPSFILLSSPMPYGCTNPAISANGRFVVFPAARSALSVAPSLVYHDIETHQSTVIVRESAGSSLPAISADGRYVAYEAVPPAGTGIYLWDALSQTQTPVSVTTQGV